MSTELSIKPAQFGEISTSIDEVFEVGDYIPYIQLLGSSSNVVKEGKFPMGHFGLYKGRTPLDIGESFDAIIFAVRPRAMEFGENNLSHFRIDSSDFQKIRESAMNGEQGYAFGPEYLLYLHDFDDFALYLFGNKSGRMEAPNVQTFFKQQAADDTYVLVHFSTELVTNSRKQSWHVPRAKLSDCTIQTFPEIDRINKIIEKFNNPPESDIEIVSGESSRPM
jgi:hypothetical protein